MASDVKAACLLNTTECILETIASILSEIQEQNNEYNWDPLTFLFTAIIGVIAISFAALTALQAFLAAGPGRIKSGAYAIGPWSWHNHRKFHWTEMRFRTTSSTPILTSDSLNWKLLEDLQEGSKYPCGAPERLRKGERDYFPATWLALLTQLSLDCTKLWGDVKPTGADYIPSEFSAVPAYGSIRFVTTLAMVLSAGAGRLTIDRESGLPRVRDRYFNLIFRQHPLLGAIGFFEMYGKPDNPEHLDWHSHMRIRLLQAHGYMSLAGSIYRDYTLKLIIKVGEVLAFDKEKAADFMHLLRCRLRQECPHYGEEPKPACRKVLDHLVNWDSDVFINGPLCLLMVDLPNSNSAPLVFPYKKAKLRERLDTLLLQSRLWGMKARADCHTQADTSPSLADDEFLQANTVTSWAQKINPDIKKPKFNEEVYELCSAYLKTNPTEDNEYHDKLGWNRHRLLDELESVDSWLQQIEPHVLCRKIALSVIADEIQKMVDTIQQQPNLQVPSHAKNALVYSKSHILPPVVHGKLDILRDAIGKANSFNHRPSDDCRTLSHTFLTHKGDISEGLTSVEGLWETIYLNPWELTPWGTVNGSKYETVEGQEHKGLKWKQSDETHPLDNLLIYRAVLITLIYCSTGDTSELMDEGKYGLIVPIM